jgi:hypothetical protein
MKNYEKKNLDVESTGDFESTKMSIDAADTGFIFDLLFNQMYRDPIGSIIREITSNCFDSHIEAKVEDAVVISFDEDEGGDYIAFQDFGIGISPDRMKNIYSKPAKSTKRDSNDQIGYFGLGSKSPLAYVEEGFFIDTISEGIYYSYLVHKGSSQPEITLITSEPTELRNGTTVKIYFKNSRDKQEFDRKLEKQLRYFDNVFVKGSNYFNNDYKIYIGKTFKFRDDCNETMHICMGKVTYPIDWSKLGVEPISIPVGLKFEIGELPVTPERESIRYGSIKIEDDKYVDTREIIKNRIAEFKLEIQSIVGTEPVLHNNFLDYYEAKDQVSTIELLGKRIHIPNNVAKSVRQLYEPFDSVGIKWNDSTFFNRFIVKRTLDLYSGAKMNNLFKGLVNINLTVNHFKEGYVIRETKAVGKFKTVTLDYIRELAQKEGKRKVIFIEERANYGFKHRVGEVTFPKAKKLDYSKTNKLKLFKYYKDVIFREVVLNSIDYADIVVPEEFIKNWELKNKVTSNKLEAEEGEIIVDNMKLVTTSRRQVWDIEDHILNFNGFVLYGFEKDEDLLSNYVHLFASGEFFYTSKIIRIRMKDEKELISLKNTIYVRSFMSNNDIFKRVATATYINDSKAWNYKFHPEHKTNGESFDNVKIFGLLFQPLGKTLGKLDSLRKNVVNLNMIHDDEDKKKFLTEVLEVAKSNNWLEDEIVKDVQRVEKYLSGLELINYIVPKDDALPHIKEYFRLSGKPLNAEWNDLQDWQVELISELRGKLEYQMKISEEAKKSTNTGYSTRERIEKRRAVLSANVDKGLNSFREILIFNKYHNGKTERVLQED